MLGRGRWLQRVLVGADGVDTCHLRRRAHLLDPDLFHLTLVAFLRSIGNITSRIKKLVVLDGPKLILDRWPPLSLLLCTAVLGLCVVLLNMQLTLRLHLRLTQLRLFTVLVSWRFGLLNTFRPSLKCAAGRLGLHDFKWFSPDKFPGSRSDLLDDWSGLNDTHRVVTQMLGRRSRCPQGFGAGLLERWTLPVPLSLRKSIFLSTWLISVAKMAFFIHDLRTNWSIFLLECWIFCLPIL